MFIRNSHHASEAQPHIIGHLQMERERKMWGEKRKKDQDSEANNVINISLFSANIFSSLLILVWHSIATKEDGPQEGGVFWIWHHLKLHCEVTDYSFMKEKLNSGSLYSKIH